MNIIQPETKLSGNELNNILQKDSVAKIVLSKNHVLNEGDLVGIRLNLNLLKVVPEQIILTIHKGSENSLEYTMNRSFFKGEALDYAEAAWLSNAFFNVNQLARDQIASGKLSNFPMASIDGNFESKVVPKGFKGIEIRFNPNVGHWFTDMEGYAIRCAEEVVVLGNRAYACGKVVYYSEKNAPRKMGKAPSLTKFKSEKDSFVLNIPKTFVNQKVRLSVV